MRPLTIIFLRCDCRHRLVQDKVGTVNTSETQLHDLRHYNRTTPKARGSGAELFRESTSVSFTGTASNDATRFHSRSVFCPLKTSVLPRKNSDQLHSSPQPRFTEQYKPVGLGHSIRQDLSQNAGK